MRQGHNGLDLGEALARETAAIRAEMPLGMTLNRSPISPATSLTLMTNSC
jgi:hypothetical protein